jgi:hypothetical protein
MGRPGSELCCLERRLHAVASNLDRSGMAHGACERLLVSAFQESRRRVISDGFSKFARLAFQPPGMSYQPLAVALTERSGPLTQQPLWLKARIDASLPMAAS